MAKKLINTTIKLGTGTLLNEALLDHFISSRPSNAAGYEQLPSGLIIQWGNATGTGFKAFPKAFPNACLSVIVAGTWNASSNPAYVTLSGVGAWEKTGFQLGTFGYIHVGAYGENIATQSYRGMVEKANFAGESRWFAIGY